MERSPPGVRVTSKQKLIIKILHRIANFCVILLKYHTKCQKQIVNFVKHLSVRVKYNWWWNSTCVCTIFWTLKFIVLRNMRNSFQCNFRHLFIAFFSGTGFLSTTNWKFFISYQILSLIFFCLLKVNTRFRWVLVHAVSFCSYHNHANEAWVILTKYGLVLISNHQP